MPNFDCPPQGPVAVGRILTDPFNPESGINASCLNPPNLLRSEKTGFETLISKESSGKFGLWTQFLSLSPLGGEAGFDHDRSESSYMYVARLETQYFVPTLDFIEQSLRQPDISQTLSRQKYAKNLYMITGVKTAVGARMRALSSNGNGGTFKVGADLTTLGVPVQVGPILEHAHIHGEAAAFEDSTDFVFAYRLREIYYSQKHGVREIRDYTKGAAYGLDDDRTPETKDVNHSMLDDFEVQGVAEEDLGQEDLRQDARTAVDDEDDGLCEYVCVDQ
ncbi:hypothetical protein NUU61_003656 [Penicillium alfredii]|uniref:Uncharacterized protein n=1 Tax=Penicillium alfredii TaxID=1506179 RepID=A0A9W9FJU7_9EURO|nr:uncharacterized protein NUU61_003656 [Penicillium alfredii]KAJ5101434.1 hypothetical protein NUU61_003656 [Penicillium alfredii]